jgi:hypothetical protein
MKTKTAGSGFCQPFFVQLWNLEVLPVSAAVAASPTMETAATSVESTAAMKSASTAAVESA